MIPRIQRQTSSVLPENIEKWNNGGRSAAVPQENSTCAGSARSFTLTIMIALATCLSPSSSHVQAFQSPLLFTSTQQHHLLSGRSLNPSSSLELSFGTLQRHRRLTFFATIPAAEETIQEESAKTIRSSSIQSSDRNQQKKQQQQTTDSLIVSLGHLKRYKTNRDIETAIVRLGRKGRTDEALQLYHAVWTLDRLKQQYRTKRQKQKQSSEEGKQKSAALSIELMLLDNNGGETILSPELATFVSKSKLRPTTRLMNSAIDACARSHPPARQQTAFEIFESAISPLNPDGTKKAGGALSPNVFTFGSLLACCARNGDVKTSTKLLHILEEGGEYPDVALNEVIYSTVISACERADVPNVELALEVLNRGVKTLSEGSKNNHIGEEGSSDDLDGNPKKKKSKAMTKGTMGVVGYNSAISTMARSGQWKMAVQLLGEMTLHSRTSLSRSNPIFTPMESIRDDMDTPKPLLQYTAPGIVPKPDGVTFGTVMAACERSGEWEELLNVARAATEYGVELDGLALTSTLHSCQQLGMADEALEYLELMKHLDDDTDDEKSGNEERRATKGRRRKEFRRPALRGPDGVAYRLAISACARSPGGHRWRDGIRLLGEMRERSQRLNSTDCAPDVVAYTAAVAGCSEAGEYTHAMSLISEMRKEGIKPNVVTFSAVINACASASAKLASRKRGGEDSDIFDGNGGGGAVGLEDIKMPMMRALRLLEAMKSPNSSVRPNIVTYNAAIRACAEGFNLDGAFDLLDQLKDDGLEPTIVTYGSLMTACERVGDIQAASKVFRMVKEEGERKQQKLEDDVENNGNDEDDPEQLRVNEIIYGAAISCCKKACEPERALFLLRKMISEELAPNTATFNTVIAALAEGSRQASESKGGQSNNDLWEKALAVYRVMKSKHAPPGVTPNRQTYNILVRCLASELRPAHAESLLGEMRKAGYVPDVDLYTATVRSYERRGELMKALALMEGMREVGYDFYQIKLLDDAFKNGVKILNRVGRLGGSISSSGDVGGSNDMFLEGRRADGGGEEMMDFDTYDYDDYEEEDDYIWNN